MSIPNRIRWLLGITFLGFIGYILPLQTPWFTPPLPSGGTELSYDLQSKRKSWFELMHRTAPGTSWLEIEYQNRFKRHRIKRTTGMARSDCSRPALIAGTGLNGRWLERGSNNQAGSVFETAYDPQKDEIWLISAGGTLWKSPRRQADWQMVNQDLQFDRGFLQLLPLPGQRQRILAFSGRKPHYSDDAGLTWHQATGISQNGPAPMFQSPTLLPDLSCFVLAKPDHLSVFEIFRSRDQGKSYQKILKLDANDPDYFSLCRPHQTDALFLARKTPQNQLRLQEWNEGQGVFVDIYAEQLPEMGNAPANLIGGLDSLGRLQLFTYREKEGTYFLQKSLDKGKTWVEIGPLPQQPWEVGLFLSPHQPEVLYFGEVEAFRSLNGGRKWKKINEWWEYYDDIEGALHADIMAFAEYETDSGAFFSLISHHGGLSISYDQFETQQNISLKDLNTSQYYSVRTDPRDPNYVYAGSQDQGLQRAVDFENGSALPQAFEQIISGDYGPIVFTRQGSALWTVYPGGWINYYDDPQKGQVKASFELISENESVWFPPIVADPRPERNGILMGGGNIDGGPGSYLITLEYRENKIEKSQIDFDFKSASGGHEISALATAPSDPDYWYASTTNGRFFYSQNQGETWEQSLNFIPEGHYLYGQSIWVSEFDPQRVILAGSGYNNPPVYLSEDGGKSFQELDDGLPPTLVFSMDSNSDESLLFAATEAGPYLLQTDEGRWYDLSTPCTPVQTYWSVEFIDALQTVRFGTYGRGIWDFQLEADTPASEPLLAQSQFRIYPNPSSGRIQISMEGISEEFQIRIFDAQGKMLRRSYYPTPLEVLELNLNSFPNGVYFLNFSNGKQRLTKKVILNR